MKNIISVFALASLVLSASAFASGFKCQTDDGYNAKIFNHVDPLNGTRTPAVLVISSLEQGTLLVRKDAEIHKANRVNTVRYTAEGNRKTDADQVVLQINFKEGVEVLEAGETTLGQLVFVKDSDREVKQVVCERYLKNN